MFCQQTAPVLERLTAEEEVTMYVLNVDQHRDTSREYGIVSTPTVIRFVGGREQTRLVGLQSENVWLNMLRLNK